MGKQSARIWDGNKDHKDIIGQGSDGKWYHHDKLYYCDENRELHLWWEKLAGINIKYSDTQISYSSKRYPSFFSYNKKEKNNDYSLLEYEGSPATAFTAYDSDFNPISLPVPEGVTYNEFTIHNEYDSYILTGLTAGTSGRTYIYNDDRYTSYSMIGVTDYYNAVKASDGYFYKLDFRMAPSWGTRYHIDKCTPNELGLTVLESYLITTGISELGMLTMQNICAGNKIGISSSKGFYYSYDFVEKWFSSDADLTMYFMQDAADRIHDEQNDIYYILHKTGGLYIIKGFMDDLQIIYEPRQLSGFSDIYLFYIFKNYVIYWHGNKFYVADYVNIPEGYVRPVASEVTIPEKYKPVKTYTLSGFVREIDDTHIAITVKNTQSGNYSYITLEIK